MVSFRILAEVEQADTFTFIISYYKVCIL
ncbi:hypothetical protein MAR_019738 [Mya arenaria]|uniref:Uncharacterized protein n=1 Tax=Mya arenaria TaxID=6604 RepID=A0ABY7E7G8_MYAAR|nr:hypothetical protein MAR_019738 [Mya arenaria]